MLRKTLSLSQKSLIIKARFGSFSDFSRPKLTYSNIARAFHLPPSTVQYIIKSFIRDGHRIIDRRAFNCKTRRFIGGSAEFE